MHQVFLFGAGSMLGWSIWRARGGAGVQPVCNGKTRELPEGVERGIDLDDEPAVAALFADARPHLIIHCAGVCDVEVCERSPEFETIVSRLPAPQFDERATSAPLSREALSVLRGVGGLAVSPIPENGDGKSIQLHRLPEFAPFVPGEQTAHGIWRRLATFENPREGRAESRQPKK